MVYATQSDLEQLGYPPEALADIEPAAITAALERASQDADGALRAAGYRTPLATWSSDLTGVVVSLAAWYLITRRGFNPELGADSVVRACFEDAQKWLGDVANRRRVIALCTEPAEPDPLPDPVGVRGASIVKTTSKRGW